MSFFDQYDDADARDILTKAYRQEALERELAEVGRELELPLRDDLTQWVKAEAVPFAASVARMVRPAGGPNVRTASPLWLYQAMFSPATYGLYSSAPNTDHIVVNERNADLALLFNQSVLVHETAHWLQPRLWGGFDTFHNDHKTAEKELGAYRAQMAYIAFQGVHPRTIDASLFGRENLFWQTHSDELFRGDYAWLQPWMKLGEYRRATGNGATRRGDHA